MARYTCVVQLALPLCMNIHDTGGFPSHVNAETPGSIHEGGELGYALAVAYGAVMDKPDLIAVALVLLQ